MSKHTPELHTIGQYAAAEGLSELGSCWHVRGPGIHSVVETRVDALWAVGICDSAYAAGQKDANAELVKALKTIAAKEDESHKPCGFGRTDLEVAEDSIRHSVWTEAANIANAALREAERGA